jgi:hypothetical protein
LVDRSLQSREMVNVDDRVVVVFVPLIVHASSLARKTTPGPACHLGRKKQRNQRRHLVRRNQNQIFVEGPYQGSLTLRCNVILGRSTRLFVFS